MGRQFGFRVRYRLMAAELLAGVVDEVLDDIFGKGNIGAYHSHFNAMVVDILLCLAIDPKLRYKIVGLNDLSQKKYIRFVQDLAQLKFFESTCSSS